MKLKPMIVGIFQVVGAIIVAVFLVGLVVFRVDLRWVIGAGNTATIFGLAWYYSRSLQRNKTYWVALLAMLLAHTVGLAATYMRHGWIPLPYYIVLGPIEGAIVYWVLLKVSGERGM